MAAEMANMAMIRPQVITPFLNIVSPMDTSTRLTATSDLRGMLTCPDTFLYNVGYVDSSLPPIIWISFDTSDIVSDKEFRLIPVGH